jgi:hypothetical protein
MGEPPIGSSLAPHPLAASQPPHLFSAPKLICDFIQAAWPVPPPGPMQSVAAAAAAAAAAEKTALRSSPTQPMVRFRPD